MKSFLTGSRVYGTPGQYSDVDLVALVSPQDALILWKNNGDTSGSANTLRFGNLNLIAIVDTPDGEGERQFAIWKSVTEELKRQAPVTKEQAVAAFDKAGRTFTNLHLEY